MDHIYCMGLLRMVRKHVDKMAVQEFTPRYAFNFRKVMTFYYYPIYGFCFLKPLLHFEPYAVSCSPTVFPTFLHFSILLVIKLWLLPKLL